MTTTYINQFSFTELARQGFQSIFWEIILWSNRSLLGKGAGINSKRQILQDFGGLDESFSS